MDANLAWAIASTVKRYCKREEVEGFDLRLPIRRGRQGGPELVWLDDDKPYALGEDASDSPGEYLIHDLAGIETHPELTALILPTSAISDLAPVAALSALSALAIGVTANADLTPLLGLEALARCAVKGPLNPSAQAVLRTLAERGVHVDRLDQEPDWTALAAPFADWHLKLAVLNALVEGGGRQWPRVHPLDIYALDKFNLARVLDTALTPEELGAIETLEWETGGLDIHHLVYPQWDGETEEFDIVSLEGVVHLPNLKTIRLYPIPDALGSCQKLGIEVEEL